MTKSFDDDGLQFAWNSTSIKLAETCLRKYQLTMIEGWQPKFPSPHLRFGGHYATALEHFHKHLASGMDREDALCEVVHEALIATWEHDLDEDGNRIPESGHPWNSMHNLKTRENLIRTIVWYLDHFAEDTTETIQLESGPAVELSFTLEVDNGLLFAGHLDRLVTYGDDQFVMDQKTTGSTLTARYFEQYKPDTQMSMYSFAGMMMLNAPVKGVIIDAAQIAVGFSRFERGFTFRTDEELNEWYDTAMYHIEAARLATRENFFPMNPSSCGNFGGCQFRHICGRDPAHREQFLKADFERGIPFDPLEQR